MSLNFKLLFVILIHLAFGIGVFLNNGFDRFTQSIIYGVILVTWFVYIKKYRKLNTKDRTHLLNSVFYVSLFALAIFAIGYYWLNLTN